MNTPKLGAASAAPADRQIRPLTRLEHIRLIGAMNRGFTRAEAMARVLEARQAAPIVERPAK